MTCNCSMCWRTVFTLLHKSRNALTGTSAVTPPSTRTVKGAKVVTVPVPWSSTIPGLPLLATNRELNRSKRSDTVARFAVASANSRELGEPASSGGGAAGARGTGAPTAGLEPLEPGAL